MWGKPIFLQKWVRERCLSDESQIACDVLLAAKIWSSPKSSIEPSRQERRTGDSMLLRQSPCRLTSPLFQSTAGERVKRQKAKRDTDHSMRSLLVLPGTELGPELPLVSSLGVCPGQRFPKRGLGIPHYPHNDPRTWFTSRVQWCFPEVTRHGDVVALMVHGMCNACVFLCFKISSVLTQIQWISIDITHVI